MLALRPTYKDFLRFGSMSHSGSMAFLVNGKINDNIIVGGGGAFLDSIFQYLLKLYIVFKTYRWGTNGHPSCSKPEGFFLFLKLNIYIIYLLC
jgi:hypothetical protein